VNRCHSGPDGDVDGAGQIKSLAWLAGRPLSSGIILMPVDWRVSPHPIPSRSAARS
jgi:hypothetical protein